MSYSKTLKYTNYVWFASRTKYIIEKLLKNRTNNTFIQLFRYAFVGGVAFIWVESKIIKTGVNIWLKRKIIPVWDLSIFVPKEMNLGIKKIAI